MAFSVKPTWIKLATRSSNGTYVVTNLAGISSDGCLDGSLGSKSFGWVTSIRSSLLVVDTSNKRTRKIVVATGETTTLAGDGTEGNSVGSGLQAKFGTSLPSGVDWNHVNQTKVAVTDRGNNQFKILTFV